MKLFFSTLLILIFLCNSTVFADQPQPSLLPFHSFSENVRYWGNPSSECGRALNNQMFHEAFSLYYILTLAQGSGIVTIENFSGGVPSIKSGVEPSGESDRLGFTRYYLPAIPIAMHPHDLYLRGIILNICFDHQKQAALMLELPNGKICIVSTHAWNYCR